MASYIYKRTVFCCQELVQTEMQIPAVNKYCLLFTCPHATFNVTLYKWLLVKQHPVTVVE